LHDL
jgi:hypothetical protein